MTKNEVNIVKNSVLDSTEAYVEARLSVLDFVRTQIGVVQGEPVKGTDRKYRHVVKCNATSNTSGITYNNVLSVGNIPFPKNSVVFLIAPNAQFSNQFILGKLDDTPCNISAGSIRLGGNNENDAPIYLSGTQLSDGSYGHIASFKIMPTRLYFADGAAISYVQPTQFRISQFVSGYRVSMMMDGSNARIAINTEADPDGGLIVSKAQGWYDNGEFYNPLLNDYTWVKPDAIESKTNIGTYTVGASAFKFLAQSQNYGLERLRISLNSDGTTITFRDITNNTSASLNMS